MSGEELSLDEYADLVAESGYGDIAVAMRHIKDAAESQDTDEDGLDLDEVTLPFHDEDFEMAFVFGLLYGARLEAVYDLSDEDES